MNKILILFLALALVSGCSSKKNRIPTLKDQADVPGAEADDEIPTDPDALFLYNNAQKDGIIVRPSGLQIRIIKRGTGGIPTPQSTIHAFYHGTLIDGTVFDSNRGTDQPFVFPLQAVIDGWQEGLMLMQEGAIYQLFVPAKLGYGNAGAGTTIPPGATLIFEVELVQVDQPLDPTGQVQ